MSFVVACGRLFFDCVGLAASRTHGVFLALRQLDLC